MPVSRYQLNVSEINWGITDTRSAASFIFLSLSTRAIFFCSNTALLTSPNNKKNNRFLDTTVCTVCTKYMYIFKLWFTLYVLQMLSSNIMFWWCLTSVWRNLSTYRFKCIYYFLTWRLPLTLFFFVNSRYYSHESELNYQLGLHLVQQDVSFLQDVNLSKNLMSLTGELSSDIMNWILTNCTFDT